MEGCILHEQRREKKNTAVGANLAAKIILPDDIVRIFWNNPENLILLKKVLMILCMILIIMISIELLFQTGFSLTFTYDLNNLLLKLKISKLSS